MTANKTAIKTYFPQNLIKQIKTVFPMNITNILMGGGTVLEENFGLIFIWMVLCNK